jgi:hypothetical protein
MIDYSKWRESQISVTNLYLDPYNRILTPIILESRPDPIFRKESLSPIWSKMMMFTVWLGA